MSKRKKKFKVKTSSANSKFNYNPETEVPILHHKHPIFCFRHIHSDFDVNKCTDEEKVALINQIRKLSSTDWQTIEYSPKGGIGTEKIYRNSINVSFPPFITKDVTHLLALRFYKKMPFLIYRDKFLAHIIFIDPKGKVYNH